MPAKGKRIVWICIAAVALAAAGSQLAFFLRYPYFRKFAAQNGVSLSQARKTWGKPDKASEQFMGMAVEASLGNWEKVSRLAATDRKSYVGTYYYNLSNAMKGELPDRLMQYYQPFERGLFLPVGEKSSPFMIGCAGDVWFELGDMSMAERDAMLGLLFSPAHNGSRYLRRLAEANLVRGDYPAASKYLRILLGSRRDRKWARERIPGEWTPEVARAIGKKRELLPRYDVVHGMDQTRINLHLLLNSNPSNKMALDYLLCLDLLTKDIDAFMEDFRPALTHSVLYEEGVLVALSAAGQVNQENLGRYGISENTFRRFSRFVETYMRDNGSSANLVDEFRYSYWYYFYFAARNEKN